MDNGQVSTSEDQRRLRRQGHFCKFADGKLVDHVRRLACVSRPVDEGSVFINIYASRIHSVIEAMPSNKGVGLDGIPAELFKAHEMQLASRLSIISKRNHADEA